MSATLSHAVRRLPTPARLVLVARSSPLTARPPICLATLGPQRCLRPICRGYASQSNNDKKSDNEGKNGDGDKKVEEKNDGKVDDPKPPPGVEKSGFRHFFSNHSSHPGKNKQLRNEEDKKNEEGMYPNEKKDDSNPVDKKESVEDRVSRMIRESKEEISKQLNEKKTNRDQSENEDASSKKEDKKKDEGPPPPPPRAQPPKSPIDGIFTFHNLFLSISAAYILYRLLDTAGDSREITWQEFRTVFLDKGLVDKLTVVNDKIVKVTLHSNATGQMYPDDLPQRATRATRYYFSIGSVEAFERRLDEAQQELGIPSKDRIPVAYSQEISYAGILTSLLPLIIVIATLTWLSRRVSGSIGGRPGGRGGGPGGLFDFSSSKAKMFNVDQKISITFKDVAGLDEAKEEIIEFVKFLKEPQVYERLGAKIPRGAILSGPPGTGKTLLAKATAGEAGVPFLSVSGSEFVEMFVGVGAARVRDLFAQARRHQPSIIFIDEIDAIGKTRDRGKFRVGNDEREQTLNQILVEMDGFGTTEHVVVLAGTNRVDTLDPALMRPGRFDRHIAIDAPDLSGRKQIFQVHLKKLVLADPVDDLADRLAVLTAGFTGAGTPSSTLCRIEGNGRYCKCV